MAKEEDKLTEQNKLVDERREKLKALRAKGVAYPNDFRKKDSSGDLHLRFGQKSKEDLEMQKTAAVVAGRMVLKRVMGKASFATLQDGSGRLQAYITQNVPGYEEFKHWDLGDIVGVEGHLFKTMKGELTVHARRIVLLVKALRPLPEKFHGLSDQEMRYRQRYVDLIVNEQSRAVFRQRTRIVRFIRDYLDALDFTEVETPMMQPLAGGAAARPFVTHHNALDLTMFLRIAPELYLKRLIVGGLERVYEINRNFRNEGVSTQHNPEFTMLELYWAFRDFRDLMELVERLLRSLAEAVTGSQRVSYQGRDYDLAAPFRRVSVAELILLHNPEFDAVRLRDVPYLRSWCERLDIPFKPGDGAGKLQIEIFEKTAEHTLQDPTFVTAYPAEVSPLSRANDADTFLTDRFEFFLAGRELANGFSELNDPEDQAERFRNQVARKDAGDDEAMHYDADYIRALEYGMPPTAGLGIGVDRLVMFLTDSPSIRDVLLFPHLRPEA
jgi:lysyl-tRNA synthetase class 2